MKQQIEFDDACAVDAGIACLRRYNRAMWISVDDNKIDKSLAEQYFRAKDGSEEEIILEKQIGAAAILSCYDNKGVPQECKAKVAARMQREFLGAFRASKVDFMYASGLFGMPTMAKAEKERKKRHQEIAIVSKTNYLNRITKSIRRKGVRIVKREGIKEIAKLFIDEEPHARWISRGAILVNDFIPEKVKEPIKKVAKNMFEKTMNVIDSGVEKFRNTAVGQKVAEVIEEKVAPVISKGIEVISTTCTKAQEVIKKKWTTFKSYFA